MNYENKKVLILGLGESGLAAARWLKRCGAVLRVADTREVPERLEQLKECAPECEFVSGHFDAALLDEIDFVVASPGLSELNELVEIVPAAKERSIPVWSEIEIFAQSVRLLGETQQYHPKMIAITGTNGKTTVTSMVGLLIERAGKSVRIAGNISPSVLDELHRSLEQNTLPDVWVLELSSFQLHSTYSFNADAATILNVTPDHLDWHGSMEAYVADKSRIFSDQTIRVINRDDDVVKAMQNTSSLCFSFGQSIPKLPDEFGLQSEHGMTWLCVANALDDDVVPTKRRAKNPVPVEVSVARLMPADALKVRGNHNALNALGALALCRAIDLPLAPLLHGLREYEGEPHRAEYVATINEVDYFDDSKGTNVHATVAAINGLSKLPSKILLIAGGVGKGQDFTPLHDAVSKSVSTVFLIGQASDEIATALASSNVELVRSSSLEQAVEAASVAAHSGDIVLLSPACASFDMFKSYAHRGDVFVRTVKELAHSKGEVVL